MDGESEEERDARIKALWDKLDTKKKGSLDLPALKNGLAKMNHRQWTAQSRDAISTDCCKALKDADSLVRDILSAADINDDGKISYEGTFAFA